MGGLEGVAIVGGRVLGMAELLAVRRGDDGDDSAGGSDPRASLDCERARVGTLRAMIGDVGAMVGGGGLWGGGLLGGEVGNCLGSCGKIVSYCAIMSSTRISLICREGESDRKEGDRGVEEYGAEGYQGG